MIHDGDTGRSPNSELALLLKPREAARALAISERTLWTLTQAGEIPAVRIGRSVRYDIQSLKRYVADQQQGGRPAAGPAVQTEPWQR